MDTKEAIERIKARFDKWALDDEDMKAIQILIPELAESEDEDERIREWLVNYFKAAGKSWIHRDISPEQILAYLERQKEPIPIPDKFSGLKSLMLQYLNSAVHRNDDAEIKSDTDLWGRKILDYVWKYSDEQKEQKPWKVGANAYFTPEQKPDTRDADDLQLLGFIYDLLNEIEWNDSWAMSKDECLRRLNNYRPQKPVSISCGHENDAEWSEEDKRIRLACIATINDVIDYERDRWEDYNPGKPYRPITKYDEQIDWLKSLRPQPKKELSIEKAIQWLDDTFCFLDNSSGRGRDCEITTHDFDSLEEMYDSFRKAVIVDSEPHWKPSEEHLSALLAVFNDPNNIGSQTCQLALTDLYEQLKKL